MEVLHTRICDLLGIRYPIIQGPMALVSGPELVAAVSNAGGLGVLSNQLAQAKDVTPTLATSFLQPTNGCAPPWSHSEPPSNR